MQRNPRVQRHFLVHSGSTFKIMIILNARYLNEIQYVTSGAFSAKPFSGISSRIVWLADSLFQSRWAIAWKWLRDAFVGTHWNFRGLLVWRWFTPTFRVVLRFMQNICFFILDLFEFRVGASASKPFDFNWWGNSSKTDPVFLSWISPFGFQLWGIHPFLGLVFLERNTPLLLSWRDWSLKLSSAEVGRAWCGFWFDRKHPSEEG